MRIQLLADRIDHLVRDAKSFVTLVERGEEAKKTNTSLHAQVSVVSSQKNRERLSERQFVRGFGDKVKKVRYGNRADFVGLLVLGKFQGFIVTSDQRAGVRRVRHMDIDQQGHSHITRRFLELKDHESLSNLQRGLLKWVR